MAPWSQKHQYLCKTSSYMWQGWAGQSCHRSPFRNFSTLLKSNKRFPGIQGNNNENVHVLFARLFCKYSMTLEVRTQKFSLSPVRDMLWARKESWLSLFQNNGQKKKKKSISTHNILLLNFRLRFLVDINRWRGHLPHTTDMGIISMLSGTITAKTYMRPSFSPRFFVWPPPMLQHQSLQKSPESHTHHSKSPWLQTHGSDTTLCE